MYNSRRGLSTIVGGLLFTILMISGFSVMSLAMDAQTDLVNTQQMVSDLELKKQQEQFIVIASANTTNYLEIDVRNTGQNPAEITNVWIINKTLSSQPATRFNVNFDDSFVPGGSNRQIMESQPLFLSQDTYDIKVVSSLGNIRTVELEVGSSGSVSNSLRSILLTDPPDVILGQNVTVAMMVTNTGELPIDDVNPSTVTVSPSSSVVSSFGPNLSNIDLIPGESVLFSWDYVINDTADTLVNFSNFATGFDVDSNPVQSNIASDASILRVDVSGTGNSTNSTGTDLIVLTQDLLARPEIFVTMPSPFGDDAQQALWGVNIVNPTAQDLTVSKIVFTVSTTRPTGSDIIINANSCNATNVPGTPAGTWNCPVDNQIMWKNLSSPASVPGFSSASFLVKVRPDSITGGSAVLETIPVTVSVFTTLGQFGKTEYATSFDEGNAPLANVYLTDNPGSTLSDDILTTVSSIPSGSVIRLNATLADFDTGTIQYIDAGSRLIINIPKGWTDPTVINAPGFNIVTPIQTFADGSSQIVGTLISDLDGSGAASTAAQTIEFDVTAPDVTTTQLYVMYVLADGTTTNNDNALGPLSEVLLQVVPP